MRSSNTLLWNFIKYSWLKRSSKCIQSSGLFGVWKGLWSLLSWWSLTFIWVIWEKVILISEFNFDVRIFCLPGRSDLLTVSLNIFLFYVKFCFQNVLWLECRMLSSEFVMCFAADSIGRHFKQGVIRMNECATCHFSVWEPPLLVFVSFHPLSSAPPNTSCLMLVWEPEFHMAV